MGQGDERDCAKRRSAEPVNHAAAPRQQAMSPALLKVRASLDLLLVLAAAGAAIAWVPDPYEALLLALAVGSAGLVWFVGRRERDMARQAKGQDWRQEAVAGRGISLADWHRGKALPAWTERRREQGDA
jgi:hypothetical protein